VHQIDKSRQDGGVGVRGHVVSKIEDVTGPITGPAKDLEGTFAG
jgi:hypothetical protein